MEKLLIIDDDPMISDILAKRFEKEGYEVSLARDGEEGLKRALDFKPDVILLDVILPKLDGIAVLKKLKGDPKTSQIIVIMLTNLRAVDGIGEAMELGATEYLVKVEYTSEELGQKVREALDARQSND